MRFRHLTMLTFAAFTVAAPLHAQKGAIDLTLDMLNRFLNGANTEKTETASVDPQVAAIDAKIKQFHECQSEFMGVAGSGGKLGFAARIAMRKKCGASNDEGMLKDRQKIMDGPLADAAKAAGMKADDYNNLKSRITGFLGGDRSGFSKGGLDLLASRQNDLSGALGVSIAQAGRPSTGGRTVAMPSVWTQDYAWQYIGYLFAMEYASGASTFETAYKPGEWTRWKITDSSDSTNQQTIERAFLARMADSSEWWRYKTTATREDDGRTVVDTVVLEAQFKVENPYYKTLVRMRGKLPGNANPQELMVPQGMGTIMSAGIFGQSRPTPESVAGATVGTDNLTVSGAAVAAKHVQFGAGGGTLDWWLSDAVPGGWLKFTGSSADKQTSYVMEMTEKGDGATSELGVKLP
jgi:hypothetical protein